MSPNEGLALLEPLDIVDPRFASLFLPAQPPGKPGLAHRLDPNALYIAMRWDYKQTSRSTLRAGCVKVTNSDGIFVKAQPADWGPNEDTGRICDLSPGVAAALGLQTDDEVTCEFIPA